MFFVRYSKTDFPSSFVLWGPDARLIREELYIPSKFFLSCEPKKATLLTGKTSLLNYLYS